MSAINLNFTEQLGAAHRLFGEDLTIATSYARLGSQFGSIQADTKLPDPPPGMQFGGPEFAAEVRRHFATYSARFAATAMITAAEVHLGNLLLLRRLFEKALAIGDIDAKEFDKTTTAVTEEAKRANPVKLIDLLVTRNREPALLETAHWLDQLVKMRNCLVHRGGRVASQDVTRGRTDLVVEWKQMIFVVDGVDVQIPVEMKGGQQLGYRFAPTVRAWAVGQPIELTCDDCQGIAMALTRLSEQVCAHLNDEMVLLQEGM